MLRPAASPRDRPAGRPPYQNDIDISSANDGGEATWTFLTIPNGSYLVAATWTAEQNRATNAPFTILGGDTLLDVLTTRTVNQRQDPTQFNENGSEWFYLGLVQVTDNQLAVQLTDTGADGTVAADAMRIVTTDSAIVIDNGDAGYTVGAGAQQTTATVHGLFGDADYIDSGDTANGATWTSGLWRRGGTWYRPPGRRPTSRRLTLAIPSTATPVIVNQQLFPNDLTTDNIRWEHLDVVTLAAPDSITVTLDGQDATYSRVAADAVRIAPLGQLEICFDGAWVANDPWTPAIPGPGNEVDSGTMPTGNIR